MYREDEFYFITDQLHHDVLRVALNGKLDREERVIIKIFRKDKYEVIMETINGEDIVIKDTRVNDDDIYSYDLVFVKVLDRYVSSYEIPNMYYEYIEGLGAWYRVNIPGFSPSDPDLRIFNTKKKITEESILNSDVSDDIKIKQIKFLNIIKTVRFSNPSKVKKLLNI